MKDKKTDMRGKHGNQGRKPSPRPMKKVTIRLYEDQLPISDADIREAVDYWNKRYISANPKLLQDAKEGKVSFAMPDEYH